MEEEGHLNGEVTAICSHRTSTPPTPSVGDDVDEPLANQSLVRILSTPMGLACCLDDVKSKTAWVSRQCRVGSLAILTTHPLILVYFSSPAECFVSSHAPAAMLPQPTPFSITFSIENASPLPAASSPSVQPTRLSIGRTAASAATSQQTC